MWVNALAAPSVWAARRSVRPIVIHPVHTVGNRGRRPPRTTRFVGSTSMKSSFRSIPQLNAVFRNSMRVHAMNVDPRTT